MLKAELKQSQQRYADLLEHFEMQVEQRVAEQTSALRKANQDLDQALTERDRHIQHYQALVQHSRELETLFSESSDGFYVMMLDAPIRWDSSKHDDQMLDYVFEHMRVVRANDAALAQYGVTKEQFIGMNQRDFFAHDPHQGRTLLKRFLADGKSHSETLEHQADGTPIYIEENCVMLHDVYGNLSGCYVVQRDITERKQFEDHLKNAYQRLAFHVDNTPLGVIEWDAQMRVRRWSSQAENILGWTADEVMGRSLHEIPFVFIDDYDQVKAASEELLSGAVSSNQLSNRNYTKNGSVIHCQWYNSVLMNESNAIGSILSMVLDITDRVRVEQALRESEEKFRQFAEHSRDVFWMHDPVQKKTLYINQAYEKMWGQSCESLLANSNSFLDAIHSEDRERVRVAYEQGRQGAPYDIEYRLVHTDGTLVWVRDRGFTIHDSSGHIYRFAGIAEDITERKHEEQRLQLQAKQNSLIFQVAQRLRQSLRLDDILNTTVTEVRHCLSADRVLIYRLQSDQEGRVIAESTSSHVRSMLGITFQDECFPSYSHEFAQISPAGNPNGQSSHQTQACYADLFKQFQVRANLVVPIAQNDAFWGALVVHQCHQEHTWQDWELDLLQQIAGQLAIAIQQSELYHQVQQLNDDLEHQVRDRTAQLQLAFNFEETLKRITDRVRDSLDENQIMQTAVEELAQALKVSCCNAALYDLDYGTSTICYESTNFSYSERGRTARMADYPELYDQLLQGQTFQFCSITPNPYRGRVVMLAQPIQDNKGVLGDLWLVNPIDSPLEEQDIRLVQQVANQCAIALRQARLYQAAQAQVDELERLNQLKDDFLSTVSHELRTPMSNMRMAIQMLEVVLAQAQLDDSIAKRTNQYFQILKNECQRETALINDLLNLSRLSAGSEPLMLTTFAPYVVLLQIIEPFIERAHSQQQHLKANIPEDLPSLTTDLSHLEGILAELLNNACKYTTEDETIEVSATADSDELEITVRNSGVTIPSSELNYLFDKFYRVPSHDPWKHGGTGLGLSLVKKRVEHLRGTITVALDQSWLTFTVRIPQMIHS
ncbi:MAG: PAS domain S-box protein [Elainellaceae cyanobacterium]